MTTEKELKDKVTPDIIKKMVELAEGESTRIKELESEKAELIESHEKRRILLDRTIHDYNILRREYNEMKMLLSEIKENVLLPYEHLHYINRINEYERE